MYPPLTSAQFSPGIGADFWLLGIGFIEISAIAGAIEIIVGVLRTRAPGMSLDKMPMFAWTMLIFAGMIVFAFPAVILATMMLELERAFGWPFFIAAKGGDALLWQHLFWFFGHPEVYIIFLPAAGMVSMIVPTMARTPLVAYNLIVVALIATGFFSFGLWVHHMFTTGIPALSLSFFSAASMAVSLPSGIQVFAWIATIASGRLQLATPSLFVLGFLFIFTLGGLTGVMVAMVPFDWQAHDTYFVVAHLHYVLVGGMVFPLFAAFYYWAPAFSRRALSERLGRWAFWLMFVGFNVAFLPMHIAGLMGMPRRVYTYPAGLGWDTLNLISTVGAFMFAAGVVVFLVDLVRNLRPGLSDHAGNLWNAGTLEWLPNDVYSARAAFRTITSRQPLWDQPDLEKYVEAGRWYLPGSADRRRETIVTSPIEAAPQYLLRLPGPGWTPFLAAVFTAAFFLLLTVKAGDARDDLRRARGRMILVWMWGSDPRADGARSISAAASSCRPMSSGPLSHAWWAMVMLLLVAGSLYLAFVFSYLYLWTVSPQVWPKPEALPRRCGRCCRPRCLSRAPARRSRPRSRCPRKEDRGTAFVALIGVRYRRRLLAAFAIEVWAHWNIGLRPTADAHAAMVAMASFLQAQVAVACGHLGLLCRGAAVRRTYRQAAARHGREPDAVVALRRRPGIVRPAVGSWLSEGRHVNPKTAPFTASFWLYRARLVWAAHFFIVYGLEAAVCTRA